MKLQTFRLYREKTIHAIERDLATLSPLCEPHAEDPAQVNVDDLRLACQSLKRAADLLAQADELITAQASHYLTIAPIEAIGFGIDA
jgi:hypothetical protein